MSEDKPAGVRSAVGGWIKAGITSVIGLVSGAVLMYVTPLVNNAIKPGKPVANFATQATGPLVEINNRSTGGVQGWWDYGDGTALDPFDPKVEIVKHVYAKPGTYNIKLTLTNLLGEESDRTAPVVIDVSTMPKPEIALFNLVPLDPRERAPCTYHLVSQVKNANFSILSVGDNRPLEVIDDPSNHQRYIPFMEKGTYRIRLAAVNGKQLVEQSQIINVGAGESSEIIAKLAVTYDAVQVKRQEHVWRIPCKVEAAGSFRKEHIAYQGCCITKAELVNKDEPNAPRNVKLEIDPEKKKVILTGELAKNAAWLAQIKVTQENRSAVQKIDRGSVTMAVSMGNAMRIPMQPLDPGWEVVRKQVSLQLWDGGRKVWESNQACASIPVNLNNKSCYVSLTPQADSMMLRVDTTPVGPVLPVSLKRDPLKK